MNNVTPAAVRLRAFGWRAPILIKMKTTIFAAAHWTQGLAVSSFARKLKRTAVVLLLAGTVFVATGCYEDPYYSPRYVRAGYYSAPAPYYGHDPYGYSPYGYGYGTGIGIGVSSYRSGYTRYGRRPYYGREYYGRQRYGDRRYYPRGDRRTWERRRGGDRNWRRDGDRPRERRSTQGSRVIRRSTAPVERSEGAPVEAQPE